MQKNENERVSLKQAAKEIGIAPQGLREYMKIGKINIGYVLPALKGDKHRYLIYRNLLDEYLMKR